MREGRSDVGVRQLAVVGGNDGDLLLLLKIYILFLFLERRREKEREGEKHQCVVASPNIKVWCTPYLGPGLQLRHVP